MTILPLAEPTGHLPSDRVLAAAVGLAETVAPGHVHSSYLVGSRAAGAGVPGSDLDLLVVLRPGVPDRLRAGLRDVLRCLAEAAAVPLDVILEDAAEVGWQSAAALPTARLLSGPDLRPGLPPAVAAPHPRQVADWAVHVVGQTFRLPPPIRLPLVPPDPADPWLGLVRLLVRHPDGSDRPGLKELVAAVLWPARSLVLARGGGWVPSKGESLVAAYRAHVGDEWTDLVAAVSRRCRGEWGYRVPDAPADRRHLRAVCERAVGFANHFLLLDAAVRPPGGVGPVGPSSTEAPRLVTGSPSIKRIEEI